MRLPRRILVGISSGIAAYKVPQLIRLLTKQGAAVRVVCTPGALRFVGEETLRTVCGHPVYRDGHFQHDLDHIRLSEWAELFLVAPATANTIAKIAHGIADNLLTTLALSIPPDRIAIAPAMNTIMWQSAITAGNVARLRNCGMTVLPVAIGELACGTDGPGRMLEPAAIVEALAAHRHHETLLAQKKVLISCGPTEEPIDPVRVITNRSSGKMGVALARAALSYGADVTVVHGPMHESFPAVVRLLPVRTAMEMHDALVKEFETADICIMAAAVSDFRPATVSTDKIRRKGALTIRFAPNPDIAAHLGKNKGNKILVGFALETGKGEVSALRKMKEKRCDLMVLNKADEAIGTDQTRITIIRGRGKIERLPVMEKSEAATIILQRISALMG